MSETQATIVEWARATFGEQALSARRIAARCGVEIAELLHKTVTEAPAAQIVDECADVAVMMSQVAQLRSIDAAHEARLYEVDECRWPLVLAGRVCRDFGTIFALLHWDRPPTPTERSYYGAVWRSLGQLVALQATGETLVEARDRKMKVNRARRWHTAPDGRSQHVEGT